MANRNICIIPARGGSKRIPLKNIKEFLGKPIIAYSIKAAIESKLFDEVMVSTDSEQVAQVAERYGATVPFLRSVESSTDFATTTEVLIEVIQEYRKLGFSFQNLCCCYPTAPFVTPERLLEGYNILDKNDVESVLPIVEYDYPIFRSFKINDNKNLELNWKNHINSRSQDLPNSYHDAGQWYWIKVQSLLDKNKIFTDNTKGVVLSPHEAQDIDTIHDWKIAELKYEYLQSIK